MKQSFISLIGFMLLFIQSATAQIDINYPTIKTPDSTELQSGKPVIKSSINGVITASAFVQDGNFGLGDGSIVMWANAIQPNQKQYQFGGDLRKTWLIFKATAYNLPNGWTATGRAELDFLGAYSGVGGFADENLMPRVRLAYVELQKKGTRIRLGQNWTPLVAHFPVSVSHFAMGYGAAGGIGFRNPGIFFYQQVSKPSAATRLRIDAAIFRGSWTGTNSDPANRDEGEIGIPQMELGVNLSNQTKQLKWEINAVAHYDQKQLFQPATKNYRPLTGKALQIGTRLNYNKFSFQGNTYWGRAIAQSWGQLLQFGDIEGSGSWAQAGYKLNNRLSAWFMYGYDNPKDADVLSSVQGNSRLLNQVLVPMIKYDIGPMQISLEWYRAQTKWNTVANGIPNYSTSIANQLALGASFTF